MSDNEWITRDEAAELAGVNVRTIDAWANAGRIDRHKVGGMQWVRFNRDQVLAMRQLVPTDKPSDE
jgi:excisionase family DNA binding protein